MAGQAVKVKWDASRERAFLRAVERGLAGMEDDTEARLATFAQRIVGRARQYCPVDTGRLRASITTSGVFRTGRGFAVEVGTNVEYAGYVEFGTVHARAQPFLRPAILQTIRTWGRS